MKKFIFLIFLSVLYATATSEIKKFDVEVSTPQQRKKEETSRTQIVEQKKAAPVILPPKEKKVSISVKPRFIGRLPLIYRSSSSGIQFSGKNKRNCLEIFPGTSKHSRNCFFNKNSGRY